MNKICTILLILIIANSCKKESNSSPYYFTFQVGTKQYSVDSITAAAAIPPLAFEITHHATQAELNANHYIAVHFFGFIYSSTDTTVTGMYTCNDTAQREMCESNLSIMILYDANNGQFMVGSNGIFTLTVTQNTNEYISGTFQGEMNGAILISNGKFKVPYKK